MSGPHALVLPPAWLAEYLSIPYVDGGRDRQGCDCFGLVRLVLADRAGLKLPAHGDAVASAHHSAAVEAALMAWRQNWAKVAERCAGVFDLALMTAIAEGRRYNGHLGIVVAAGWILHTEARSGPVCARAADPRLSRRIHSYWRWVGPVPEQERAA